MKNTQFRKSGRTHNTVEELFQRLNSGDRAALAESITLVESKLPENREKASTLLRLCLQMQRPSCRIAISGIPGVGKSTFIEAFGLQLIANGSRVAVLAIDPSSSLSGGSILGDKTRMEQLSVNSRAFIRPSANAGHLGGVARNTRESILLCEAAGFDTILVETVGVGQSEAEARHLTDLFLLLAVAGTGDDLQGIKRGIMELPDAVIINKAELSGDKAVKVAEAHLKSALHLMPFRSNGIVPEVMVCDALSGLNVEKVVQFVDVAMQELRANGRLLSERKRQELYWFDKLIHSELLRQIAVNSTLAPQIAAHRRQIADGKESSFSAADQVARMLADWLPT